MLSPGWDALIARAAATAWSMALLSASGLPGERWRSFQYAFTTQPRTAVPMYCGGGWPSRSRRPWRTGFSGPLVAVVPGDDDAGGTEPVSGPDGHVPRRWHRVAWRAARRAARSAWRSAAVVTPPPPLEQAATSTARTATSARTRVTGLLPPGGGTASRWRRRPGPRSTRQGPAHGAGSHRRPRPARAR